MPKYYSYMRISTDQERQSFNRQKRSLERYAKDHGFTYHRSFVEEKSARDFDHRPEFLFMESILQQGDTVVFKDLYRFMREAENGYARYMSWLDKGVHMVFLDNPIVSSDYIRQMLRTASEQDLVARTALESTIRLLLLVELDRGQKQREYISQSIRDGIAASSKKSGRKKGQLDKMTDALKADIEAYLTDRSIRQIDLIRKFEISRNTLKKYIDHVEKRLERQ